MKVKLLFIVYLFLYTESIFCQTTLTAGDIAIIQYNSDNSIGTPELIKFITFKYLEAGTVINFTDHGWKNNNTFRNTEGIVAWMANRDFVCGEIITMEMPSTSSIDFTLTTIDSGFALSSNGDQILVFQGDVFNPNFIFAINNEGNGVWQASATNSNTSSLPSTLTNGTNSVALQEVDNVIYSGPLSGSRSTILSNIM